MNDRLRRRDFVRASALGLLAAVNGCESRQLSSTTNTETGTDRSTPRAETGEDGASQISGRVVALSGAPVDGASVRAVIPGVGPVAETETDGKGQFGVDTGRRPVWLKVSAAGFHERTVAAGPRGRLTVELTAREGTVSLSFCGDVMFGRRFYGTNDEHGPHVRISSSTPLADHRAILRAVAPLLASADITSVNLETPLTTTAWRHPQKVYTFASHPVAGQALAEAGVEYAALGNNHAFDALVPGLEETLATLTKVGMAHSGAGRSSEAAWRPALFEQRGRTIGYLSCTTVVESQYAIDLSADRGANTTHTVTRDTSSGEASLMVPGNVGVAEATEPRLAHHVSALADNVDVTAVQIHGGYEYRRRPIAKIRGLAEAAITAGADLVVCHHPHVTGGLEMRNGALIAWSLGNFVFDQTRWETFPSYVLTVHIGAEGVKRAYVDPVLLEGYVPTGVVGKPRANHLWRTAGLSSEEFALGRHTLQYVRDRRPAARTANRMVEGDTLYTRQAGWPKTVLEGAEALQFGRDRLPTGQFDDPDVDDQRHEALLWQVTPGPGAKAPAVEYMRNGSVQLEQEKADGEPTDFGPVARIPVSGPLTFAGRYRYGATDGVELHIAWYEGLGDSLVTEEKFEFQGGSDEWAWMRQDLTPPEGASYVDVTFHLSQPAVGERPAAFDDLRLVEWTDDTTGSREYDHLRVDGTATVEFAMSASLREGAEIAWSELND